MPGRLFLTATATEIAALIPFAGVVPALAPRLNIAPGEEVLAIAPEGAALARWGLVPVGRINARGRPVMETIVNVRSESLFSKTAFCGTARAVVPASGWFEWTGRPRHKQAWRITAADGGLLLFAAISDTWTAPGGRQLQQVATVTCAPNADVEAVHDRMGALLSPAEAADWLVAAPEAARGLLRPLPAGSLTVERAEAMDSGRRG